MGEKPSPATNWPAVWVILAAGYAAGAHMTKVPPALPALRADFGVSMVESGFIHSMMYAIGAALGIFGGATADRFGQKRFGLIGLVLMAAGSLAGALSHSFALLLAARFCEGVGFILLTVSAAALLAEATRPKDRATAFSLWGTYMPTGGTVALLVAPLALASTGWRSLWLALSAYTVLCIVLFAKFVPAPHFATKVSSAHLLRDSLSSPGALALCLAFACYVGQWSSLMAWLPTFAVDERAMSQGSASLLTAAFVAINIPGNLLGGLLLRKGISRRTVLLLGSLAMGTSVLGILLGSVPDSLRLACLLAFSLLGGMIPTAVFSGTPVHAKSAQHVGTVNGMVMQASHLSQFTLPVAIAWVATRFGGWSASLGLMLSLAALGAAAGVAVGRYERR